MQTVKAASLKLDYNLYPRKEIDSQHLAEMCEAERAGVEFPPVTADRESKRVTDGFHRVLKQLKLFGEGAELQCEFKRYGSEQEMFLDAMRLNANHGHQLSPYDRAHCILIALELKIPETEIALALSVTNERIALVRSTKIASIKEGNVRVHVPIKRTIAHMAGLVLTAKQQKANEQLGGMSQLFYANQLVLLIENDLLDTANDRLMNRLKHLKTILP
jgi:hypothetical protein